MSLAPRLIAVALLASGALGCDEGAVFVTESDSAGADARGGDSAGGTDTLPQGQVPDGVTIPGPGCGPPLTGQETQAPSVPWKGFVYGGKTYTCNECPQGVRPNDGQWRHIDGRTEDPDVPLDDSYRERLTMSGNTWTFHSDGVDSATGAFEEQTVSGWYFCGDESEIPYKGLVFYTTEVANPGAFGWEEGIVISADLFTDGTGTGLLFVWRDGISPPPGIQDVYCRIGTTVTVPASDDGSTPATQKACTDPFAQ
ncbi:MAG: hypothetical protein H6744_18560 [Deltaproteobacteria bacterium]|nr:hypothetical protein [Deltaproteobacteria bacterium]MCB9788684.1 hypothetical protein [Deltaproteobacteria bacterium]